jgi:hypothetical protein
MGIPEDDLIPYRHAYGNYTHTSANGKYKFEWTPFTPAIEAWRKARYHFMGALDHLVEAQKLPGFALNGLADHHLKMMEDLKVITEDTAASRDEAAKIAAVLEVANRDYALANEASLEQYQSLMGMIDNVNAGQTGVQNVQDSFEHDADAQQDQTIHPFDPPPPPAPAPPPTTQNHVHGKGF